MDVQKIGLFLAALRRERGLTQEQLGEQLGVTNKTVSRWEKGNYLPPVEMLQSLSEFYNVSINELLSGERLTEREYREKAEENIKSALDNSFTLKEKIAFYKKKWSREHRGSLIAVALLVLALYAWGFCYDGRGLQLLAMGAAFFCSLIRYNRMMAYVEARAFDPAIGEDPEESGRTVLMRRIRVSGLILLAVSIWLCVDLGYNFFSALVPEINDGLTVRGVFGQLFFGSDGRRWSLENYFRGFMAAFAAAGMLGIGNIALACAREETR